MPDISFCRNVSSNTMAYMFGVHVDLDTNAGAVASLQSNFGDGLSPGVAVSSIPWIIIIVLVFF